MKRVELAFRPGVVTHVEVEDDRLLFVAAQRHTTEIPNQVALIESALERPIGSARLGNLLSATDSVVILVDDVTRQTPAARILPHILARIRNAGVPADAVTVFVAMGTHRPMTQQELHTKLGDEILHEYRVVNRDYREGPFVDLGKTDSGIPIEVNQEVLNADIKIAVGNVVPHIAAGWGGGSKMILPGACSQRTTEVMHLTGCIVQPVLEVIGRRDNRPRAEMDEIARRVGLDFIVNTVLDEDQNLLGVFAGDCVEAHRAACRMAERAMIVPIPALADILIVSANPSHVDYWQGIKAYAYAHRAVRRGGVVIFLLDGAEGLCGDAPSHDATVRRYLPLSFEEQKAAAEQGEVEDLVGLGSPMYHASLRHLLSSTIIVTNHLTQPDIDLLGFDSAANVQAALERAFSLVGADAQVGIIPFGGETLVRVAPGEC
jgi:nickel-dependent lactate racemase